MKSIPLKGMIKEEYSFDVYDSYNYSSYLQIAAYILLITLCMHYL